MHFSVMSRSHRTTYYIHNYTSHDMKFSIVKRCLFQIIRCNFSVFPRYALFVMAMIHSPRKGDPGADVLLVNTSKIQYCPVCSTLSASHFGAIRQTDTDFFSHNCPFSNTSDTSFFTFLHSGRKEAKHSAFLT